MTAKNPYFHIPDRLFCRPHSQETKLHTAYRKVPESELLNNVFRKDPTYHPLYIYCTDEEVTDGWGIIYYRGNSYKKICQVWCPSCRAKQEAREALRALTGDEDR